MAKESASKEAEYPFYKTRKNQRYLTYESLASRVYYLEEAAKVARQREVVRVVRPVEVKVYILISLFHRFSLSLSSLSRFLDANIMFQPPILSSISASSATAFISSLFGPPTTDVPPANSLTHCFKQGFLTKQGSGIKYEKRRKKGRLRRK